MAHLTSYSIYVRFRGRRLALMKHIRSLETACSALRALRAERFHDADQVFLVNDATKQVVDEATLQAAESPGVDRAIAARSSAGDGDEDERGAPTRGAEREAAPPAHEERAPARLGAPEAPARGAEPDESPERRWSSVEHLEPPEARLRRAMAAARAARARHDAALKSLIRLQTSHRLDERALFTIERSARTASEHAACTLEQLEQLLKHLDSPRWRHG
ncbi:hypothetical protein SOCE26_022380 [Sorangium cellulosum]|uniref:Uncharacterized protein n=1 Tax=Sorangium cellulosum TaxID=56 RepID=A0A2L0ENG3_SORCE|nr:hypothetical protein [Sorangium cellulosum]AUX40837.1 hypothetical protein SOCE26_022380 [Sorangium cellulosum]